MYNINDTELFAVPIVAEGNVVKIMMWKKADLNFLDNPVISDLAIKTCYEPLEGMKQTCSTVLRQKNMCLRATA